jgi:ankyrin repeat protein
MTHRETLLNAFEIHSVAMIEDVLSGGVDPNAVIDGKSPLTELVEMYYRSPQFSECVRALVRFGARCDNEALLAVLLDDADLLAKVLKNNPAAINQTIDLRCAFTPLMGASLLHVACEFGHLNAASVLLAAGIDIEAKAALDAYGFNGHTPIFHTVCQHRNHCMPVLRLLLSHGAKTDVRLSGITWGKGFEWETTLFDPTPISYAQAGLLRQFQREENDVYENIRLMMVSSGRAIPEELNVPNAYLSH